MDDESELNFATIISNLERKKFNASVKRRRIYAWAQRFKDSWKKEFSWVEQATDGSQDAYCTVCCKNIRCKKDDIVKHDRGKRHRLNIKSNAENDYNNYNDEDQCQPQTRNACKISNFQEIQINNTVIRGIDVGPELHMAISALSKKLNSLSSQLLRPTDPDESVQCTRSMEHIMDVLSKMKNF